MRAIGDAILGEDARTDAERLADAKAARRAAVAAEYERRMAAGFPCNFGSQPETLQVSTPNDLANWLTLKDACRDAATAGLGAMPVQPPIRTTSNALYSPSITEALVILNAMRTWGGAVLSASWRLKDAVDGAAHLDALDAIDLSAGWP